MLETRELKRERRSIVACVTTDMGCVRETNEDSGRHTKPGDLETISRRGELTVVADGMGGHASGEVASNLAVDLISEFYYADTENSPAEALRIAIQEANALIFQKATSEEQYFGMGTTIIALAVVEDVAYSAHVGDSRLYRLRNGRMEIMTTDHSQVMELVKLGLISFAEARDHDDKNVILRAVGTHPTVEVEVSKPIPIQAGDGFLLCSDGLNDMLEDSVIAKIWSSSPNIFDAGENLIEAAKREGGDDNVTVALVRVPGEPEQFERKSIPITREMRAQ